jgi:hypothetical protein
MAGHKQTTSTPESAACAWCIEEMGETPQDGDSHGICEPHAEQMLVTAAWGRLQRVPAYVERFADGREEWEGE